MESLFAKLSYMGIRPHNQQKETSNNVSPRVLKKEIILKKLNKQPVREKSKENFSTSKQDRNIKVEPPKNKTHSEQIALFSHELEGYHEQMDLIDLIDEAPESLYNYLTVKNYEVIDKRHKGGNLWLVGGAELRSLISELRQMGINFQFSNKGSRATKYRPGWFTSYMG